MSNFKKACRAIQIATGLSYQSAYNRLRLRASNDKTLDENVADIVDEVNESNFKTTIDYGREKPR